MTGIDRKREYDVLILGAGAAGLFCAIEAGKRGRRVAVLEHTQKIGSKILISGGGRCNFTNRNVTPQQYFSDNPKFCISALKQFSPNDFIQRVKGHRIPFHEKKLGQLFCDRSARDILNMLLNEAKAAKVQIFTNTQPLAVEKNRLFITHTSKGDYVSQSVVVATGGLSIPKMGATGFGYEVAKAFQMSVTKTRPALDGFVWNDQNKIVFTKLAGVSCVAKVTCGRVSFTDDLLFTHLGLSGPAALQASLYWDDSHPVQIDFLPQLSVHDTLHLFENEKANHPTKSIEKILQKWFPQSLAQALLDKVSGPLGPIQSWKKEDLRLLAETIHGFSFVPRSTVGYKKAEVTRGGIDTDELSSKTMESKKVPGLYFIGEVVDVTGWLGGYNFQWAWSSGFVAGQNV